MTEHDTPTLPTSTRFELLAEHHNVQPFDCDNVALTEYLKYDALTDMKKSISQTWVYIGTFDGVDEVMGYISLCADLAKFIHEGTFELIQVPLIYLCFIARHKTRRHIGIGDYLLIQSFSKTMEVAEIVGVAGMHIREATRAGRRLFTKKDSSGENIYGFVIHPSNDIDNDKGLYVSINHIKAILAQAI